MIQEERYNKQDYKVNFFNRYLPFHMIPYYFKTWYEFLIYHSKWVKLKKEYNHEDSLEDLKNQIVLNDERWDKIFTEWDGADKPDGTEEYVYSDNQWLKVINNKWGDFKLDVNDFPYYQIISKFPAWRFLTPLKNKGVLGYPAIKYNILGKGSAKLRDIVKMLVHYRLSLYTNKRKYNVAFDFWLIDNQQWVWKDVKHEIMIWDDYHISRPNGNYKGTVKIGGIDYFVYSGYIDKSKENLGIDGWILTTFLRKHPQRNIDKFGLINLETCIRYMRGLNILSDDEYNSQYLHSIELGTEVYNSDGMCYVHTFDIEFWQTEQSKGHTTWE